MQTLTISRGPFNCYKEYLENDIMLCYLKNIYEENQLFTMILYIIKCYSIYENKKQQVRNLKKKVYWIGYLQKMLLPPHLLVMLYNWLIWRGF